MKLLPYILFCFLMLSAVCSGINSYHATEAMIVADVNQALEQTLRKMPNDVVTADTIRCYRNHLTISEIKDTAGISMRAVRKDDQIVTTLIAEANCDGLTIFRMSNQKASSSLFFAAILCLLVSLWHLKRNKPEWTSLGISYGGIVFHENEFIDSSGERIRLTPMQHTLLEMFMTKENHTLTKQEICDALWPKKPDASDTLYTLIRRIKPIIEEYSNLRIESDRGKSYTLKIK